MKEFVYTIRDENGIHARSAGMLVKLVKGFGGSVTVHAGDKQCDMKRLMALMGLGIKQGGEIRVCVEGEGEEAMAAELEKFLRENL